jgi:MFS family permease
MPTALFPAFGVTLFHGGARDVGFLYAAPGLGALVASVLSGWTGSIRRPGLAVCYCIAVWGVAITAFGFSHLLPLALFFLAIAGGADVISAVFRSTIIQTEAPDQLRGRLSSFQTAVVGAGPRLGNFEAGGMAALAGTQFSVVSGGIGCVVGIAIIARLLPKFLRYELPRAGEHLASTTGRRVRDTGPEQCARDGAGKRVGHPGVVGIFRHGTVVGIFRHCYNVDICRQMTAQRRASSTASTLPRRSVMRSVTTARMPA